MRVGRSEAPRSWNSPPILGTLPELQEKLDRLAERGILQINPQDYERLFGTNDVAAARVRNFARAHACVVSHADGAVLFRKKISQPDEEALA